MPPTNVEAVRRAVAAYSERDVETLREHLDPAIEWQPAGPAAVEHALYRGHAEFFAATAALWEVWEVLRFEEQQIRELAGGSVLWLGRAYLQGSASHIALDQEFGNLFALREARLLQIRAFTTWSDALAAAGLTA